MPPVAGFRGGPVGLFGKIIIFSSFVLLVAACSQSGNSAASGGKQSLWSQSQISGLQSQCISDLQTTSVDSSKINPICTCWVGNVTTQYSPDEAELDSNVSPIQNLLNLCGQQAGLPGPLALVQSQIRELLSPIRDLMEEKEPKVHIPKAPLKVLAKVRNNPLAGKVDAGLLLTLQPLIEEYLQRPKDRHLRLFPVPIAVENLKTDANYPPELEQLSHISKPDSALFIPLENSVEKRLHFLAEKIESVHPSPITF